ncbi:hypothetical protein DFH07DRAFT_774183 [Mycena maculata]|uniref:Uncharacterized protein n=1 Tax=Mycena maculata TaxID=230809 RepID=A0AAD7IY77_9AGAR|nr:hypothetical protein DFH07DRAFT_774183 [Mycena maculata]
MACPAAFVSPMATSPPYTRKNEPSIIGNQEKECRVHFVSPSLMTANSGELKASKFIFITLTSENPESIHGILGVQCSEKLYLPVDVFLVRVPVLIFAALYGVRVPSHAIFGPENMVQFPGTRTQIRRAWDYASNGDPNCSNTIYPTNLITFLVQYYSSHKCRGAAIFHTSLRAPTEDNSNQQPPVLFPLKDSIPDRLSPCSPSFLSICESGPVIFVSETDAETNIGQTWDKHRSSGLFSRPAGLVLLSVPSGIESEVSPKLLDFFKP